MKVRAAWWLLPATSVALFLLPLVSPVVIYPKWDEFIVAFDAQRLLNGQVPYRDFFNFIPPGVLYFLAAVALPAGKVTLTLARYASLMVVLANWLLLRLALRKAGWSRGHALLFSLVYPVCLYPFWPVASHHWLVHLACMGFLLTAAGEESITPARAALMGFWAGAAGTVLQTEALYVAAGGLCLILLAPGPRSLLRTLAAWTAGLLPPLAVAFGPLFAAGAGPSLVRDVFLWPAANYSRAGNDNARGLLEDLPFRLHGLWSHGAQQGGAWVPPPLAMAGTLLYAMLVLLAAGLAGAALWAVGKAMRRRAFDQPLTAVSALVTVLAFGLFLRGRPGWIWMMYLLGFVGPLWLVASAGAGTVSARARRSAAIASALLLVCGAAYHGRWIWSHLPEPWELGDVDRPIRESAVNRWLHSPGILASDDTVVAFPEGGEVYLYGASPAIGYTLFMPLSEGYNSPEDHRIAAREMAASRPRWVLLPTGMEAAYLDHASPVGVLLGRDYVRAGTLGDAVVLERR